MAKDPGTGDRIVATIESVKGDCNAGHKAGESFEISCYDTGGLCGWFYHMIFSDLSTFQYGGKLPWWEGDVIHVQCPDSYNTVTMKLERFKRD
jgi:uncharacterized repeat protein (TIGR04076 family)